MLFSKPSSVTLVSRWSSWETLPLNFEFSAEENNMQGGDLDLAYLPI